MKRFVLAETKKELQNSCETVLLSLFQFCLSFISICGQFYSLARGRQKQTEGDEMSLKKQPSDL